MLDVSIWSARRRHSAAEFDLPTMAAQKSQTTVTVVIPEFVVSRWYEHLLHNQSALILKGKLLFREGIVVTSVPYHVDLADGPSDRIHPDSSSPTSTNR